MKSKAIILTPFIFLYSLSLISAQISLGEFFGSVDPSTMVLGSLFIIFFAVINLALSRVFRDPYGYPNTKLAGIISFFVSLLIVYGINLTGLDFESLFSSIGVSEDLLFTIIPIVFIIASIYLFIKFKSLALLILGILLLLISFTDLVYEKTVIIGIGILLIVLFVFLFLRRRKKPIGQNPYR